MAWPAPVLRTPVGANVIRPRGWFAVETAVPAPMLGAGKAVGSLSTSWSLGLTKHVMHGANMEGIQETKHHSYGYLW